MDISVGVLNLILGSVYTQYGLVTLIELKHGLHTRGCSHFGAAWVAMAFTWDILRSIRGDPVTENIPLVLCTVKNSLQDEIRGLMLRADSYIKKPFHAEHLLGEVTRDPRAPSDALRRVNTR